MDIRPIETRYKGRRFRSRLEARWAVLFDAMGWPWEYEPQGYTDGTTHYLPDFFLPVDRPHIAGSGLYFEAKPRDMPAGFSIEQELLKWRLLTRATGRSLVVAFGQPGDAQFVLVDPDGSGELGFFGSCPCCDGPFTMVGGEDMDDHTRDVIRAMVANSIARGVDAARGARFEHGESPGRKRG